MKMLTVQEVKALVIEMEAERKKTKYVPHYYKRNGKILERSYPDRIQTARYEELFYDREKKLLRGEVGKIFKCCECGKMCGYFDLECWSVDELNGEELLCSECYENDMGEDL